MKKPILSREDYLKEGRAGIKSFEEYVSSVNRSTSEDEPLYTGRFLVTLKEGSTFNQTQALFESTLGMRIASSKDFTNEEISEEKLGDASVLIYEDFGVALVGSDDDQTEILQSNSGAFFLEPEKVVRVPNYTLSSVTSASTWGINATGAANSGYTGAGVKVAVLDTGFDLHHPDYAGRQIRTASFVPNETVQDFNGHGTHCIGSACGNVYQNGARYGVANESTIYAGEIFNRQGNTAQAWIFNAIDWAIKSNCDIISMSFGSKVYPGLGHDPAYERAAQYALQNGTLMVAAVGNDSARNRNYFVPVSSPANCPSILGVAAIDSNFRVGDFSNRAINVGGTVGIAAPGVDVYSSWPMNMRYRTISGTSMATPHVAGICALIKEKYPSYTPQQIWQQLVSSARPLTNLPVDIGAGLAIAP